MNFKAGGSNPLTQTRLIKIAITQSDVVAILSLKSCHRQLRKVTNGKSVFPNDESLRKMLYLALETMDLLRRWTGRVQNRGQILLQLPVFFPNKAKSSLARSVPGGQKNKTITDTGITSYYA